MALPKSRISKLIVLEPHGTYLRYLKPLEKLDPRVVVRDYHPKDWHTYRKLREEGLLDEVQTIPWDAGVHPQLHFMMHVSMAVHGEQLLSQLLRAIPDAQWLFQQGRVPMSVLLLNRMWDRIKAEEGSSIRCKVSVMAQAAAECKEVVPSDLLSPFTSHFHPALRDEIEARAEGVLDARRFGNPVSALSIVPHHNQFIKPGDLEFWDYCLRKLFVKRATPLSVAIPALGPGAAVLLPKLADKVPLDSHVRNLTVEQWQLVVEAFKNWPFRPQDLGIVTFFEASHANR